MTSERLARRFKEVEIDGMTFRIQSISDRVWTKIQASAMKKDGTIDRVLAQLINARVIVECVVDADGNCIFTESDVNKIRDLDAGLIARLADACRKHVGADEPSEELKNE